VSVIPAAGSAPYLTVNVEVLESRQGGRLECCTYYTRYETCNIITVSAIQAEDRPSGDQRCPRPRPAETSYRDIEEKETRR